MQLTNQTPMIAPLGHLYVLFFCSVSTPVFMPEAITRHPTVGQCMTYIVQAAPMVLKVDRSLLGYLSGQNLRRTLYTALVSILEAFCRPPI